MTDWRQEAREDAQNFIERFKNEVVKMIMVGKVSDPLNDFPGGATAIFHGRYVDRAYTLKDAAELLDELDEYEETSTGLWEGLSPRDAIKIQAAFTYGNAVAGKLRSLVRNINERMETVELEQDEKHDLTEEEAADILEDVLEEWEMKR